MTFTKYRNKERKEKGEGEEDIILVSVRIGQKMGLIFLKESADKPKIVDALLGEEVIDVACGWNHVVVLTSDAENPIFTWGIDTNGCLGKLDCLKLLESGSAGVT